MSRRHVLPIGLDIGPRSVRLLQLARREEGLIVSAAAWRELTDWRGSPSVAQAAHIASMLRQMLGEGSFVGKRVIAALPDCITHLRTIRIPDPPPGGVELAARREAEGLFPFNLQDATIRLIPAGAGCQAGTAFQEIILCAVQNQQISGWINTLRDAGVRPDSLQLRPVAAYRAATRNAAADAVHAVVDIGWKSSMVTIGRGSAIQFIKGIGIGGELLHESIARKLRLSFDEVMQLRRRLVRSDSPPADRRNAVASAVYDATRGLLEDLARQVSLCFRYHAVTFRGARPERVALVGSDAADPYVTSALAGALALPVNRLDAFGEISSGTAGNSHNGSRADWSAALGLVLPETAHAFAPRNIAA